MAVPMKLVSIDSDSNSGRAAYAGSEMDVSLGLVTPEVGDYLLVHAGCAIEIVRREQAEEIADILQMLEETVRGA